MKMPVLALIAGLCLTMPLPAYAETRPADGAAMAAPEAEDIGRLMSSTGLDAIFSQFGTSIAETPALDEMPTPPGFDTAWKESAANAFDDAELSARLRDDLARHLDADDIEGVLGFIATEFGARVNALELETQDQPPQAQEALLIEGAGLYQAASERRISQFDEMLALTSAEISNAMLAGSIRAMMIGLHMADTGGDIAVPWDEIDAQVSATMDAMAGELDVSLRSVLAYTYRDLSDDELEDYLAFLRTPAAQKFYALTAMSVGTIVNDAMENFGESLAARLGRIEV